MKNQTSFTFSARRSYMDLFMSKFQEWMDDKSNSRDNFYFYDLNAKLHHRLDEKSSFYVTAYAGRDNYKNKMYENDIPGEQENSSVHQNWRWGSTVLSTRFNRILGGNLFFNVNLSYNRYAHNMDLDERFSLIEADNERSIRNRLRYDSGIRDYSGSVDWEFIPSAKHYMRFGSQIISHDFRPEVFRFTYNESESSGGDRRDMPSINATEFTAYAEDEWSPLRQLILNTGARFSVFYVNGKNYNAVDPRLSALFLLREDFSIKAGYSRMQQYVHLLSSNSLLFQTDLWVPVTNKVKPMNSNQYSLGIFKSFGNGFEASLEAYYKTMDNLIEYKDGASFLASTISWEEKVVSGVGRSYGWEFLLERNRGRLTGTATYAWSKTERRFNEINDGVWFPARFDRRHTVNFSLSYQLNEKMDFTTQWSYASGDMMTIPLMTVVTPDIPDVMGHLDELTQLDSRNNYRLPAYHRLDWGMNYTPRKKSSRYGVWNLSVYNLYNRMNVFKLYVETDVNRDSQGRNMYTKKLKKITLFPVLPSISYTYHF